MARLTPRTTCCADDRDEDAPGAETVQSLHADEAEQKSTDQRSDDPQNDVNEDA